jgi:hypothetical protein
MAVSAAARQTASPQRSDPQRAGNTRGPLAPSPGRTGIRRLQGTLGNQAMQRLLQTRAIQPKLTVGPADDEYEREA